MPYNFLFTPTHFLKQRFKIINCSMQERMRVPSHLCKINKNLYYPTTQRFRFTKSFSGTKQCCQVIKIHGHFRLIITIALFINFYRPSIKLLRFVKTDDGLIPVSVPSSSPNLLNPPSEDTVSTVYTNADLNLFIFHSLSFCCLKDRIQVFFNLFRKSQIAMFGCEQKRL